MAALMTINSILDNTGVLDPFLKYIFKNEKSRNLRCNSFYYSADNKKMNID